MDDRRLLLVHAHPDDELSIDGLALRREAELTEALAVSMAALDFAADPDFAPELGPRWQVAKVYWMRCRAGWFRPRWRPGC